VRAGIVGRAEEWPWSSFATTLGMSTAFPFVDATPILAILGGDEPRALCTLRGFVNGRSSRAPG
jgi:hypothetical protein